MRLTTTAQVTVDGVMQGLGGPMRSTAADSSAADGRTSTTSRDGHGPDLRARRHLPVGRRTYEIFAGSWGTWEIPWNSPICTALDTRPKYVASTTPSNRSGRTRPSSPVTSRRLDDLKARPGGELQVHGSGALFRWLLENHLVDEMNLFTFPVVVGQGTRLFPRRPGRSTRTGGITVHSQRGDRPVLSAWRAPAVCNSRGRLKSVRRRCRHQTFRVRWLRRRRSPPRSTCRSTTRPFSTTRTSSRCACCLVTSLPESHMGA